jgi:hypothetical protein
MASVGGNAQVLLLLWHPHLATFNSTAGGCGRLLPHAAAFDYSGNSVQNSRSCSQIMRLMLRAASTY